MSGKETSTGYIVSGIYAQINREDDLKTVALFCYMCWSFAMLFSDENFDSSLPLCYSDFCKYFFHFYVCGKRISHSRILYNFCFITCESCGTENIPEYLRFFLINCYINRKTETLSTVLWNIQ